MTASSLRTNSHNHNRAQHTPKDTQPLPISELEIVGYMNTDAGLLPPAILAPVLESKLAGKQRYLPPSFEIVGEWVVISPKKSPSSLNLSASDNASWSELAPGHSIPLEPNHTLWIDETDTLHYEPNETVKRTFKALFDSQLTTARQSFRKLAIEASLGHASSALALNSSSPEAKALVIACKALAACPKSANLDAPVQSASDLPQSKNQISDLATVKLLLEQLFENLPPATWDRYDFNKVSTAIEREFGVRFLQAFVLPTTIAKVFLSASAGEHVIQGSYAYDFQGIQSTLKCEGADAAFLATLCPLLKQYEQPEESATRLLSRICAEFLIERAETKDKPPADGERVKAYFKKLQNLVTVEAA